MDERPEDWGALAEEGRPFWDSLQQAEFGVATAHFRLAGWLLEVAPLGLNRANNGSQARIRFLADAWSTTDKQLEEIRYVGSRIPPEYQYPDVSWSVCKELARVKDDQTRFGYLEALRDQGGKITIDSARKIRGLRPSHPPTSSKPRAPKSVEADVAKAQALLAKPEVRQGLREAEAATKAERAAKAEAERVEREAQKEADRLAAIELRKQQRKIKEAEEARKRIEALLYGKRLERSLNFWSDVDTQLDGAGVLLASLYVHSEDIPEDRIERFRDRADRISKTARKLVWRLSDHTPEDVIDADLVDDAPELMAGQPLEIIDVEAIDDDEDEQLRGNG